MLHHTSGIRDYIEMWYASRQNLADSISEKQALDLIAQQKALNFAPGAKFDYSNSNYLILSMVVKRVSGKSLRTLSDENIFQPLGMRNTQFHDDRTMVIKDRAAGHFVDGQRIGIFTTSFDLVGDGGLYTTVEDLYRWDQNFYHNKLGQGGQGLIEKMLEPGRLDDGQVINYACGLRLLDQNGFKLIGHEGGFIGFSAAMYRFPEQKFSVIVLCNLDKADAPGLAHQVADIYLPK